MKDDYPAAVMEATDHLERYKRTGEEGLLWRAYLAARQALSAFPPYAAAFAADHPGWSALTPQGAIDTLEAVLVEIDELAAARVTGKGTDSHAAATLKREQILAEIRHQAVFLAWRQDDIESATPERRAKFKQLKLTKSGLCERVAKRVGVTRTYVQKVWGELKLSEATAIESLLVQVSTPTISAAAASRKSTAPKGRALVNAATRPSQGHRWRKQLKKK